MQNIKKILVTPKMLVILCFDKLCQDRRMPDAVYIIYCQILASFHYELHINWDWVYRAHSVKLRDHDNF